MPLLYLDRRNKGWLGTSIFVLIVNLIVFIIQKHLSQNIVLLVVLLTPAAWVVLYFLSGLVFKRAR
jgi:hypothetical protein